MYERVPTRPPPPSKERLRVMLSVIEPSEVLHDEFVATNVRIDDDNVSDRAREYGTEDDERKEARTHVNIVAALLGTVLTRLMLNPL